MKEIRSWKNLLTRLVVRIDDNNVITSQLNLHAVSRVHVTEKQRQTNADSCILNSRGSSMNDVVDQIEPNLTPDEFVDVLTRSTLAQRRPVAEAETIRGMLQHADLILTARIDKKLVGVSRAITDFSFCTYLSDLAVDVKHQRRGIGRELIRRTHEQAGLSTTLILLTAPQAVAYYSHIGMNRHDSCWTLSQKSDQST